MIKIMMRLLFILIALALTRFYIAPAQASERMVVYTVNYPLQYFAQRIAGDLAEVILPVPQGIDPAFWHPDAATVSQYQAADLILLNGANYAKWIATVTLSRKRMVNTSSAFAKDYIHIESGVAHSHGAGAEHAHGGTAFTTWLDFSQADQQAFAILQAFSKKRPEYKAQFENNYATLSRELNDLDKTLRQLITSEKPVLASHPVYQYLARRYSINLRSVMWEPDSYPSNSQWSSLEKLLKNHPARWMVWESEPTKKIQKSLQTSGIQVVVFSPCMNRPAAGDFNSVMKQNLQNLGRIYN